MRPSILNEYKLNIMASIKLWLVTLFMGPEAVDAGRAAYYKPHLFGRPYYRLQDKILHAKSIWSKQQREHFAAVTATATNCVFCKVAHAAFAQSGSKNQMVLQRAALDNGQDNQIKLMTDFIEKLTRTPWDISTHDLADLQKNGFSMQEIEEAAMCCIIMNIGSRLSAALNFRVLSPETLQRSKPLLLAFGYRIFY